LASFDQAEGLRRLLETPHSRVVTVLSALPEDEKSGMLANLGVSLARQGKNVLMVDARASGDSIGAWLNADFECTLLDVARQQRTMQDAIKIVSKGLSVTALSRYMPVSAGTATENSRRLSRAFDVAANRADLVLVDCDIDMNDAFPMASLDESDVVIQVSAHPDAIKAAYGLIKRLNARLGRRSYGIVVTGAGEAEAQLVYANMAKAASRYLAVPLHLVGHVPEDEHVRKAARLGRAVIDAFPLARASLAFSRLAEQVALSARSGLGWRQLAEMGQASPSVGSGVA
jgi:flagellar biosynthesis protein FlhG